MAGHIRLPDEVISHRNLFRKGPKVSSVDDYGRHRKTCRAQMNTAPFDCQADTAMQAAV